MEHPFSIGPPSPLLISHLQSITEVLDSEISHVPTQCFPSFFSILYLYLSLPICLFLFPLHVTCLHFAALPFEIKQVGPYKKKKKKKKKKGGQKKKKKKKKKKS